IGELARVAVLNRKYPGRKGLWATLVGTVVAHRVFDVVPVVMLVLFVLITAKIPTWAYTSLWVVIAVGVALTVFAFFSAGGTNKRLETLGPVVRLVTMARRGLGVMRDWPRAALAIMFQILGWTCQLFAVWAAMRAFDIHAPLPAAGLVLLLMNVATIFPLWPGNFGLVQAAVALPLVRYGVSYARGFAFGIGLQAIEASVGVGVGLLFLAREGLSFAMLKRMPDAGQAEVPEEEGADARTGGAGESERRRIGGAARIFGGVGTRSAARVVTRPGRADPRGGGRGRLAARLPWWDGDGRRRRGDARGAGRAAAADARGVRRVVAAARRRVRL